MNKEKFLEECESLGHKQMEVGGVLNVVNPDNGISFPCHAEMLQDLGAFHGEDAVSRLLEDQLKRLSGAPEEVFLPGTQV